MTRENILTRFCNYPFTHAHINSRGEVHVCCTAWLELSIGNIFQSDFDHVWNSDNARAIRESNLDGSFRFCNATLCPVIVSGWVAREAILEKWQQIKNAHYAINHISVSIDAVAEETFLKLCEEGDFKQLLINLKFLNKLKSHYKFRIKFNFAVQEQNFEEMPLFVELARQFLCDKVAFAQLNNLGTYSPEEYSRLAVHLLFQKFKRLLHLPIFKAPIVSLQNLSHLLREDN